MLVYLSMTSKNRSIVYVDIHVLVFYIDVIGRLVCGVDFFKLFSLRVYGAV